MLSDVMAYFNFQQSFDQAGYFETEQHKQLMRELELAIHQGGLVAMTGSNSHFGEELFKPS